MERDTSPGDGAVKREAEPQTDGRSLKRKKTVTWAELPDEALPPAGASGVGAFADAPAGEDGGGAQPQQRQQPVVTLPCDGLYDAVMEDLLLQQEDVPGLQQQQEEQQEQEGEGLSRRQLLERRLARAEQLSEVYEGEMWTLLEELRLRHAQFVAQPGLSVWKEGAALAPAAPPAVEGKKQQKQREQSAAVAAKEEQEEGDGPLRPGSGLRALWEAQQAEQTEAAAQQSRAQDESQLQGGKQQSEQLPEKKQKGRQQQQQAAGGEQKQKKTVKQAATAAAAKKGEEKAAAGGKQQAQKEKDKEKGKPKDKAAAGKQQQQQQQQRDGEKQPQAKQGQSEKQQNGEKLLQQQQAQEAAAEQQQQQDGAAQQPTPALAPLPPLPRFEDVESLIVSGAAAGLPPVDEAGLVEAKRRFVRRLQLVGRLEQGALGAACRQMDSLGGLALLCGRRCRYVIRRAAVAIGRGSESHGKVDVDLAAEGAGPAQRVSRQQAVLLLEPDGSFRLRCTGRRGMMVNGVAVARGQTVPLPTLSHVRVGDVSLLFVANVAAAQRAAARSALPAA